MAVGRGRTGPRRDGAGSLECHCDKVAVDPPELEGLPIGQFGLGVRLQFRTSKVALKATTAMLGVVSLLVELNVMLRSGR